MKHEYSKSPGFVHMPVDGSIRLSTCYQVPKRQAVTGVDAFFPIFHSPYYEYDLYIPAIYVDGEDDSMQFTANVQALLDALTTVTRALAARPAKQILEGVLVEAQDERITLTCSDGSLTIETNLPADIKEEGRTVLPGRILTELVRKLPGGEMTVKVNENHAASIKCMASKSNLAGMNPMEYPEMATAEHGVTVQIPQKELREMISRVVFAIATDESRQILTGSLLEVTADEARMVALDGFRLAIQKVFQPFALPDQMETLKAVIPGRVLNELSKILADEDEFCTLLIDKSRMQASFGHTKLSTVLLAGEYIDYRKILPQTFKTTAKANREAVQNAIDRASLMAREGKNNLIRMSFAGSTLAITSNAELGDVHEEMEVELSGDPLEIAFNAKYITDVIRNISDEELCMHFNSHVSPCVIMPAEGDAYLYLILPVRVFS